MSQVPRFLRNVNKSASHLLKQAANCLEQGQIKNLNHLKLIKNATILSSGVIAAAWTLDNFEISNYLAQSFQNGKVYAWGFNQYGQLGIGSETNEPLPTQVDGLENVIQISCGTEQSAAITSDGKVYTFGRGQDARLGHGESGGLNETEPRLIEELSDKKIIYVDAGYLHMAAIDQNGDLYTWGKNSYNQLGRSGGNFPQKVSKLSELGIKCSQVACGRYHTVVLDNLGQVYAWGGLKSGETGTGNKKNTPEPTLISTLSDKKVIQIAAGQDFTLFLTDNGDVYACGAGDQGQTGQGATKKRYNEIPLKIRQIKNVSRIAAGQFHAIACTIDGKVYSWGLNREGQLGHGDTQNRTTPSEILDFSNNNSYKVIDVAAGGGHSACLIENTSNKNNKHNKELYVFGRGRQGQIGRANNTESVAAYRSTPVQVDYFNDVRETIQQIVLGANHSCALSTAPM